MSLAYPARCRRRPKVGRGLRIETLEHRRLLANDNIFADLRFSHDPLERVFADRSLPTADQAPEIIRFVADTTGRLIVRTITDAASGLEPELALEFAPRSFHVFPPSDDIHGFSENRQIIMQTQDRGVLEVENDHGDLVEQHYAEIEVHLAAGEYLVNTSSSLFAVSADTNSAYSLLVQWQPTGSPVADCLETNPGSCPYELKGEPWSIITADFNADGFTDLATANSLDNDVSILYGLGDGTFRREEESFPVGESPGSLTADDFNNDGQTDLAVANARSNSVTILLQQEGSGFSDAPGIELTLAAESPDLEDTVTTKTKFGREPRFITSADLDQDGNTDLLVICEDSADLWIFYGSGSNPNGPFTIDDTTRIDIGNSPRHVSTNDIDGDGVVDIIVPRRKANDIYVLRNTLHDPHVAGKERFVLLHEMTREIGQTDGIPVGKYPFAAVAMEFQNEQDRYTILASTNDASDSVSILYQER